MRNANRITRGARIQHGFTLIELMVGLVLGMLTVLVITEVLVMAEGRKRTLTMGSDAQVNGALSMFALQRDIQMAGYGAAANPAALGCNVRGKYDSSGTEFSFPLAPVRIDNGADGSPDSVTILQSRTTGFSAPLLLTEAHPSTANYFVVRSSFGAVAGANSLMIVVPPAQDPISTTMWCSIINVTHDASSTDTTLGQAIPGGVFRIPHTTGTAGKWNQNTVFPSTTYPAGSYLLNMGAMAYRTYAISDTHSLQVTERSPLNGSLSTQELYPQIVNLQALYGKDVDGNGLIDTYETTAPVTNVEWQRVLAIRIAVVARSNQYEKEIVTRVAPKWDVGSTSTINGETATTCNTDSKCIDLKVNMLTDWEHYRYKVYDTIIPLRNVLWNS